MKKILMILSLIVVTLFLFGCIEETLTSEELEAEMKEMSDEEFNAVLSDDDTALAGQAFSYKNKRLKAVKNTLKKDTKWLSCKDIDTGIEFLYTKDGEKVIEDTRNNYCKGDKAIIQFCGSSNKPSYYAKDCTDAGETCNEGECVGIGSCTPHECTDTECSVMDDGCGSTVDCGGCEILGSGAYCESETNRCMVNIELEMDFECDLGDNLLEGESQGYSVNGVAYDITVEEMLYQAYAGGVHSVTFNVNGDSFTLLEGESYELTGGNVIALTEILYQSYAGGVHSATFCIGTNGKAAKDLVCNAVYREDDLFGISGTVFEYRSSDNMRDTWPKAKFKNHQTGETFERSVDDDASFNFPYEGNRYNFVNASSANVDDWDIRYVCDVCIPHECIWQEYAGGIKECGVIDDGCGGTVNCKYQAYAGGLECPSDYECTANQCVKECDVDDSLMEGESENYNINGTNYDVYVEDMLYQNYAGGIHSVDFVINNENLTVQEDETRVLIDNSTITVTEMLYQSYAGGIHQVTFCMRK